MKVRNGSFKLQTHVIQCSSTQYNCWETLKMQTGIYNIRHNKNQEILAQALVAFDPMCAFYTFPQFLSVNAKLGWWFLFFTAVMLPFKFLYNTDFFYHFFHKLQIVILVKHWKVKKILKFALWDERICNSAGPTSCVEMQSQILDLKLKMDLLTVLARNITMDVVRSQAPLKI